MLELKLLESKETEYLTHTTSEKNISLNAAVKTFIDEKATPRKEYMSWWNKEKNTLLEYSMKVVKAENYKEFTILQIINKENDICKPIIRFSVIDSSIYITYKDKDNVNHYTKFNNFSLNEIYTFKVKVLPDYIDINDGKWRYENWATKYRYQYGIYSQTDFGEYEIEIIDVDIKLDPNN